MRKALAWVVAMLFLAAFLSAFLAPFAALTWILLAAAAGLGILALSMSRWKPTQGSDSGARQAEARLWSTLNSSRR